MRALLVLLALVAVGLMAAPAHGATVTVRVDPDSIDPDFPSETSDEVLYVAGPGERNRLLVAYAGDARSVTVHDPGATIAALGSCTSVDVHTAICRKRPEETVEWLQSTRVLLGDLDDQVRTTRPGPAPIGGVIADGGPGDDRLDGGEGSDVLDGGGGRDELLGGEGFDVLSDGDRDGAADDAGPGPDVLDGGADGDEVSYAQRTAGVRVDLERDAGHGAAGENDVVRAVENATGGTGEDRLSGDDRDNQLAGGGGDDRLSGRAGEDEDGFGDDLRGGPGADRLFGGDGPDRLIGGSGADTVACGRDDDTVYGPRAGELLERRCERVHFTFGSTREDSLAFAPYPRSVSGAGARFRLNCPDFEIFDGEPAACRGILALRETRGQRRRLGQAGFDNRALRDSFGVRVGLSPRGRRLARRREGVIVTAFLRGSRLPDVAWTIRLRL
jgi:hypothetical protein